MAFRNKLHNLFNAQHDLFSAYTLGKYGQRLPVMPNLIKAQPTGEFERRDRRVRGRIEPRQLQPRGMIAGRMNQLLRDALAAKWGVYIQAA